MTKYIPFLLIIAILTGIFTFLNHKLYTDFTEFTAKHHCKEIPELKNASYEFYRVFQCDEFILLYRR